VTGARRAALLAGLLLGVVGCGGGAGPVEAGETEPAAGEVTLAVHGMTCATCAVTVRVALGRVEGVASVDVDVADGRAVVRYQPDRVDVARIADAIGAAGYPATILEGG
jgi:copper chaperone CopZ